MLSDRGVSIIIFKLNNLAIKIYIGLFFQRKIVLQSESPSGMCAKLNTVAASNNRIHLTRSLYYCLFAPRIWVLFFTQRIQCNASRGCNNIPSFLQWTAPTTHSFCEGFIQHDLHILVTAPFSCDPKAQVACMRSFSLWQQATTEFTW